MDRFRFLPPCLRLFLAAALLFATLAAPAAANDNAWRGLEKAADHDPRQVIRTATVALERAVRESDLPAQLKALRILSVARSINSEDVDAELTQGIGLARQLGDMDALAWLLHERAWFEFIQGRREEGSTMLEEAMRIAQQHGLRRTLAWTYWRKGNMLAVSSRVSEVMPWLRKSYDLFEAERDNHGLAVTLSSIGHVYNGYGQNTNADDRAKAIAHWERALGLIDANAYRSSAALFTLNLGAAYFALKDFQRARSHIEKALALARDLQNSVGISYCTYWLAKISSAENRHQDTLAYLDIALRIMSSSSTPRNRHHLNALTLRALTLARLGRKAESLAALKEATQLQSDRPMEAVALHFPAAKIHALLGDSAEAYRHMLALREAEHHVAETAKDRLTDELKVRFDVRLKDAENAALRAQRETADAQRLTAFLALALALAVAAGVTVHLRRRAALAKAEAHHHKALADAKSAFLANMSHELRSPLNAMLGFSRLLIRSPGLPGPAKDDLGIIVRSGEHLYNLINEVLNLSKVESGQMALQEKSFDPCALLDELEATFSLQAKQKGIQLDIDASPALPPLVSADAVKLRQVLINLIGNAIKFTESGSVTLRAGLAQRNGDACRLNFTVADSGVGIAPDELAQLGQAFVQARAGRQSGEGTGLGLAISRGFVRLMGGELTVASEPGRGTIVGFDIPARVTETADPDIAADAGRRAIALAPGQPRYRILAADDLPESRQLLVRLLAPLGFEVREARNGREAVEMCALWQPHLVWMDMRMPVMGGLEATRRIRESGGKVVIVALTASSFEEEREEILAGGCDGFLRKPFREDALLALMERHLGVAFLYDDPAPPLPEAALDAARLAALPGELTTHLRDALGQLDVEAVDAAIEAVRRHDAALGGALFMLAARFEYDRIQALLPKTDTVAAGK